MGIKQRVTDVRDRHPALDHLLRAVEHYGEVKGGQQAGGITYFAFLSVFPVLALAFFAIGYVARVLPDAQQGLLDALGEVLPGLIGDGKGQVSLDTVQERAGAVGLLGLVGILYAGLGWLSSLRAGLMVLFELPDRLQPNFVLGKVRDLATLFVLGAILFSSVGVSAVVTRFTDEVLNWLHLGRELGWLVTVVAIVLGLAVNAVLFLAMFRLLARPPTPRRALWSGALLGGVGFELLKQLSSLLITSARGQPAFQVFGTALVLLVWFNYFSRIVLYAAAWAHTSLEARAMRPVDHPVTSGPPSPPRAWRERLADDRANGDPNPSIIPFTAGAGAMLALVGLLRRRNKR